MAKQSMVLQLERAVMRSTVAGLNMHIVPFDPRRLLQARLQTCTSGALVGIQNRFLAVCFCSSASRSSSVSLSVAVPPRAPGLRSRFGKTGCWMAGSAPFVWQDRSAGAYTCSLLNYHRRGPTFSYHMGEKFGQTPTTDNGLLSFYLFASLG